MIHPKVAAASTGGALTTVILAILKGRHVHVDEITAAAIATLVMTGLGYLAPKLGVELDTSALVEPADPPDPVVAPVAPLPPVA
jgi:hypothetical protein